MTGPIQKRDFAAELGTLGYPDFSYLKATMTPKPDEVLLDALGEPDLDARVLEGLPWLALTYMDMDWDWLVQNAKCISGKTGWVSWSPWRVNWRKGKNDRHGSTKLRQCLDILERARLSQEDTFCHDSMTQTERAWVREHRSPTAARWNLLTDMKAEQLSYSR